MHESSMKIHAKIIHILFGPLVFIAVIRGMKAQQILGYYQEVLRLENLPPVPLVFCRVGKGGACVEFNPITKKPVNTQLDMNRCHDPEHGILHEVAHLKLLIKKGYGGHDASFRKEEARLVDKYSYSDLTFKYFCK